MNFEAGLFGNQHRHASHLSKFHRDLDVGGKKSILNRARLGIMSMDDFLEGVADS